MFLHGPIPLNILIYKINSLFTFELNLSIALSIQITLFIVFQVLKCTVIVWEVSFSLLTLIRTLTRPLSYYLVSGKSLTTSGVYCH